MMRVGRDRMLGILIDTLRGREMTTDEDEDEVCG